MFGEEHSESRVETQIEEEKEKEGVGEARQPAPLMEASRRGAGVWRSRAGKGWGRLNMSSDRGAEIISPHRWVNAGASSSTRSCSDMCCRRSLLVISVDNPWAMAQIPPRENKGMQRGHRRERGLSGQINNDQIRLEPREAIKGFQLSCES